MGGDSDCMELLMGCKNILPAVCISTNSNDSIVVATISSSTAKRHIRECMKGVFCNWNKMVEQAKGEDGKLRGEMAEGGEKRGVGKLKCTTTFFGVR